jgi:K+-sensing histidine kinase KdpD
MLETFAELVTILLKNGRQYSELLDARTQVESVTALGLMAMITGVWQHANKGRAITIRDRASLLQLDVSDGHLEEVPKHIEVIQDAAKEIATRKIRENLADPSATRPVLINDYLRDYIGRWINIQGHTGIFVRPDVLENEEYLVRIQAEWFSDLLDIIFNNARQVLVGKAVPQITVQSYVDNIKQTYTCMIWDNGPGFPKNELEDLFTKRILKKHNETGSGIGLLMARLIVESFGGRIKGRNHEKGGACITMTFPLEQSKKEEPM